MESPEAAREMECFIVLQAFVGDVQLLLSLPLTPFTYHVLAEATELHAKLNKSSSTGFSRFAETRHTAMLAKRLVWGIGLLPSRISLHLRDVRGGKLLGFLLLSRISRYRLTVSHTRKDIVVKLRTLSRSRSWER